MELEQLLKLINTVSDSKLTEFKYETESVCIKMGKESSVKVVAADAQTTAPAAVQGAVITAQETKAAIEASEEPDVQKGKVVTSPLVGTFYAAPSEDADPYVKVGDTVKVVKLHGEGAVKRRIMDMGITKGTEIFVRKVAPLGDPVEVTVRGYELSLRKADAEMIAVR